MSVKKRKNRSGKIVWCYVFDAPGSTRGNRRQIKRSGFGTKGEAQQAEAARRIDAQREWEESQKPAPEAPKTLRYAIAAFLDEHAARNLAPKTTERYRELGSYLCPALLDTPVAEVTALDLHREWNRLLESGGRHRKTKAPRPLSAKTVRHVCGLVSSVYGKAILWGLAATNPAEHSDPPVVHKREGAALSPAQQRLVLESSVHWALPDMLEFAAATGVRRGEMLAARWSDLDGEHITIARSLSQTKAGVFVKATKRERVRTLKIPAAGMAALERQRTRQAEFRAQFGPDYRADLDLIFCQPDGTPWRPDTISAEISALFKRLKIPKPKGAALHLLRHTHGSHLLASGMEMTAVSERLGHESTATTARVYAHAIKGRDEEAARRWEEFQQRAGNLNRDCVTPA
jgi:integrase